jgi:hypothetical protein
LSFGRTIRNARYGRLRLGRLEFGALGISFSNAALVREGLLRAIQVTAMDETRTASHREAWNKGKLVGQKVPFKLQEIWAIRIRLQMQRRLRELALFNLGLSIWIVERVTTWFLVHRRDRRP